MSLERILHGRALADKFAVPDLSAGSVVPAFPARPPGLLPPTTHRRLPSLKAKDTEHVEGQRRILHELANHELQAIELLAMALCRWPDAPEPLRRALACTLADEQRHCQLYLKRLRALGGEVGDTPVSTFFWDTLGTVATLDGFIAGLSLCFETANLDFAQTWRDRFRRAGDEATAQVLQIVLDDEIRHVSLGLAWFSEGKHDVISAWQRALPKPLTAAHARGTVFNAEARRRAGFKPEQIRQLQILGGHRSKRPRVLAFDAAVEDAVVGRTPSANTLAVTDALAHLPLFLALPSDIVAAPQPNSAFLDQLAGAGFVLPRFDPHAKVDQPWGPTPLHDGWVHTLAQLSDKCATHLWLEKVLPHPLWVEDRGEIWTEVGHPAGPWILKAPFSASGSRRIRGEGPLTEPQRRWAEKQLRSQGRLLKMPLYDRVADLSVHLTVGQTVRIDGITRFETLHGRFTGAWPGPWIGTFGSEKRALHGNGDHNRAIEPALRSIGEAAGAYAQDLGFRGPLSLDALLVRRGEELRLHPCLEINARSTLGRVALAFRPKVRPQSQAFWHLQHDPAPRSFCELKDGRIRVGCIHTTPRSTFLNSWLEVRE